MTLPTSGQITWAMIRDEFGGTNPIYINQYYRGGARVPNSVPNENVPTSGQISASQFYGARNYINVSGSATGGTTSYNLGAPSTPSTRSMSTTASATASGGTGSYTYTWSITNWGGISGVPTISGGGSSITVAADAMLNELSFVDVRCIISDGVSSVSLTATCHYDYHNNSHL